MPVIVVESPAKAKTIGKYLGSDYQVVASYGHVRDLPEVNGSVIPEEGFAMKWEIPASSKPHIKKIADALSKDRELILATDPDREGEAISWHILEVLRARKGVKIEGNAKRVVFHSVTKNAVTNAMEAPRDIDMELVDAYLARRALDYLVGYTLSPVLWRKLPGARSAGRVQSVCVRIIVEREKEILDFDKREFWNIVSSMTSPAGEEFEATLVQLDGRKLDKFSIPDETEAGRARDEVQSRNYRIDSIAEQPRTRKPPPPFVTATLQQAANVRLRMAPRITMRAAQRLYEAGLITYMRTDGVDMAPEAVAATRKAIAAQFGGDHVAPEPRMYKTKAKNSQEAHECIRTTDPSRSAGALAHLEPAQRQLYELIWARTLACQMASARYLNTTVDLLSDDGKVGLRAVGSVVKFEGFQKVYGDAGAPRKDADAAHADAELRKLPQLAEGDRPAVGKVVPTQHFTQPPPRYNEASLIKKMVDLGIGRPSTYSSIVSTIQDRGYVVQMEGRLVPEPVGKMLTAFLQIYFSRYVEYEFTADLEEELDDVSGGRRKRQEVLGQFWTHFTAAIEGTAELRIGDVLDKLTDILLPQYRDGQDTGDDIRKCPKCGSGRLSLRTARNGGAFFGCSAYPECRYLLPIDGREGGDAEPRELGADPESGLPVTARHGPYGPYLQMGPAEGEAGKPKRVSIPKEMDPAAIDLETALQLLSLPREVGRHPEDDAPIHAGIGRYGGYVKHGSKYANLEQDSDVLTVGINMAVDLLAKKKRGRGSPAQALKDLGEHPSEGGPVKVLSGRYGPYVNWKKVNATLPKDMEPQSVTIDQAVQLIAERQKKKRKAR